MSGSRMQCSCTWKSRSRHSLMLKKSGHSCMTRRRLSAPGDSRLRVMQEWPDFFSISECRDLLFHVQEHCMRLPDIKAFLAKQGLTFLGFELAEAVARGYAARFPADAAMTDLDCWHQFETANPHTFRGMYEFWVQKPAASGI